ncbi:hypothetical protein PtrSN002B_004549 [Pyrenophora tritici-repentis]|nr:hypothetical protein PtrSN001A_005422 [Pyrenophora tritici-repentis]KAI1553736.1 hypothetical protein PtrSN002B_004549 [Pyrenophora tritici-repentis]KAI1591546.1 hypothetical protein PtrEW13061_004501 [Pyrenophora tritici-repentis]PWO28820.1 hypothetical protein PtrARCrB10_02567 [Pyrenophora tritici-repentis]
MMPASQPRNPTLLDRSNRQEPASSTNNANARYKPQSASTDLAEASKASPQRCSDQGLSTDPFAYYNAISDTRSYQLQPQPQPHTEGSSRHDVVPEDDYGYTCRDMSCTDMVEDVGNQQQQQTRGRAVPYNLAVRLANRSNGAPLATIIEQGSYSTLNSRGSLLSVGRFPSLRGVETTSPSRTSLKLTSDADEHARLQRITEDAQLEQLLGLTQGTPKEPSYKGYGNTLPVNEPATPSVPTIPQRSQSAAYDTGESEYDASTKTVKAFFRGVLHNVRTASRTRSRSSCSSSTHDASSIPEHRQHRKEADEAVSYSQLQASETFLLGYDRPVGHGRCEKPYDVPMPSSTAIITHGFDHQNRQMDVSTAYRIPPISLDLLLLNVRPYALEPNTASVATPQLLPPPAVTHPRERSPSVRLVHPEPRDEAQSGCSTGNVFYAISTLGNTPHPLAENDCTTQASRNASFCTMSTSYSGPVVGVDIDLQHDFPHPVCRSQSTTPVAPVWFTPQMAELERQASTSESPEATQATETQPPRRSITSSALTTLLPIAAASGIVRPNYDTPKISFFSPSGSLIQPEDSSTPDTTTASEFSGSPTRTSYYGNPNAMATYTAFPPKTCLPPPRPLRPMTTPPTSSAPLPAHLRYHHNYRRPEQSQIDSTVSSTESFIVPTPAVKGCDGMMRSESIALYSRARYSYEKTRLRQHYGRCRSIASLVGDLKNEARVHKARTITAIMAHCTTSGKGRVLRKRVTADRRAAATAYVSMPRETISGAESAGEKGRRKRNVPGKRDIGLLGPLAGHALRVCFCQPFDGAGKPTHAVASESLCMSSHTISMRDESKKENSHTVVRDVETDAVLPNARVVSSTERNKDNSLADDIVRKRSVVYKGERRIADKEKHSQTRRDSFVGVGAAFRNVVVGG